MAILITTNSIAQSTSNPEEYMNYFLEEFDSLNSNILAYQNSINHGRSARKVERKRIELINSSEISLNKFKVSNDFKGNNEFKKSAIEYFSTINTLLKEDYKHIVDLETVAEQSYETMKEYLESQKLARNTLSKSLNELEESQNKFAAKYDLTPLELSKPMENVNQVIDHYNDIFLVFFKSNKEEGYLLDAIGDGDIGKIEEGRISLKSNTDEGLEKLTNVALYSGDNSLVEATETLLRFYAYEGDRMQLATDYFITLENFNKVKEAFEQKKESQRTQEDVDQYNNAINKMNFAVEAYNEANEIMNKERSSLIHNWNRVAEEFKNRNLL